MTEELVEKRLTDIEDKIDRLTELISQTQLQEYRISVLENEVKQIRTRHSEFNQDINKMQRSAGDTALKWIGIVGGGFVTIMLGYIASQVGLK